jgi:LSD1 subclass zinc finger protein
MQVTCTDCKKPLRIPDSAAGKKVRCPSCQAVFTALPVLELGPTPPKTTPPPLPTHFEPVEAPPRAARVRVDADDYDDAEPEIERGDDGDSPAQDYLSAGAFWLTATAIYFIVSVVLSLISLLFFFPNQPWPGGGGRTPALMVFMMLITALWFAPPIFMLIGAHQMRTAGSRGLVITGVVFDFIMCVAMTFGFLCNVLIVFTGPPNSALGAIFKVLVSGGGLALGITAGVKTLTLLGNPAVKEAFGIRSERARAWEDDDNDEWERRRRLRRRHGGEE